MEQGAVDAPPIKIKNQLRPQQRLRRPKHKNNLCLDRNKDKRTPFGSLQGDKTVKQAMPTAVRQETDDGGKQRAQTSHRGLQSRPQKTMVPNFAVGPKEGEGKL